MQAEVLLDITSEINRLPNNEEMILNINDTYEDQNVIDIAVNMYAKQKGFIAIKYHKDLDAIDKTIIRRHVYSCWKARINHPKKVENINLHRNSVSTKQTVHGKWAFILVKTLISYVSSSSIITIIIDMIQ